MMITTGTSNSNNSLAKFPGRFYDFKSRMLANQSEIDSRHKLVQRVQPKFTMLHFQSHLDAIPTDVRENARYNYRSELYMRKTANQDQQLKMMIHIEKLLSKKSFDPYGFRVRHVLPRRCE